MKDLSLLRSWQAALALSLACALFSGAILLVPVASAVTIGPRLTVTLSGDKVTLSFPTQNGASYQVEKKEKLTDPTWTPLGSAITGTGSVQSFQETVTGTARFYRVAVTGP